MKDGRRWMEGDFSEKVKGRADPFFFFHFLGGPSQRRAARDDFSFFFCPRPPTLFFYCSFLFFFLSDFFICFPFPRFFFPFLFPFFPLCTALCNGCARVVAWKRASRERRWKMERERRGTANGRERRMIKQTK